MVHKKGGFFMYYNGRECFYQNYKLVDATTKAVLVAYHPDSSKLEQIELFQKKQTERRAEKERELQQELAEKRKQFLKELELVKEQNSKRSETSIASELRIKKALATTKRNQVPTFEQQTKITLEKGQNPRTIPFWNNDPQLIMPTKEEPPIAPSLPTVATIIQQLPALLEQRYRANYQVVTLDVLEDQSYRRIYFLVDEKVKDLFESALKKEDQSIINAILKRHGAFALGWLHTKTHHRKFQPKIKKYRTSKIRLTVNKTLLEKVKKVILKRKLYHRYHNLYTTNFYTKSQDFFSDRRKGCMNLSHKENQPVKSSFFFNELNQEGVGLPEEMYQYIQTNLPLLEEKVKQKQLLIA